MGVITTIMRFITKNDGDLSSYFDKNDETGGGFTNSSLKHMLIDSLSNEDNKGKIRANLPLEHIFGFCKTFKK